MEYPSKNGKRLYMLSKVRDIWLDYHSPRQLSFLILGGESIPSITVTLTHFIDIKFSRRRLCAEGSFWCLLTWRDLYGEKPTHFTIVKNERTLRIGKLFKLLSFRFDSTEDLDGKSKKADRCSQARCRGKERRPQHCFLIYIQYKKAGTMASFSNVQNRHASCSWSSLVSSSIIY